MDDDISGGGDDDFSNGAGDDEENIDEEELSDESKSFTDDEDDAESESNDSSSSSSSDLSLLSSNADEKDDDTFLEIDIENDEKTGAGRAIITSEKRKEDKIVTIEQRILVGKSVLHNFGFVQHHLDSYEKFVFHLIPHIVHETPEVVIKVERNQKKHVLEFGELIYHRPTIKESNGCTRDIYPQECRERSFSYNFTITVNVKHSIYSSSSIVDDDERKGGSNTNTTLHPEEERFNYELTLCQLPAMLKSGVCHLKNNPYMCSECPLDQGGYFVINGQNKIMMPPDRMKHNHPYVFPVKQPSKFTHVCETRSCHKNKLRSTSTLYCYISNTTGQTGVHEIYVKIPFVDYNIPLVYIFHLLGIWNVDEMIRLICENEPTSSSNMGQEPETVMENVVYASLYAQYLQCAKMKTVDDIFDFLGKKSNILSTTPSSVNLSTKQQRAKRINTLSHIFSNEFLPHMGLEKTEETQRGKVIYFGHLIHKLFRVKIGKRKCDDKDDQENKRVETCGYLMATLFRALWRNMLKYISISMKKVLEEDKRINMLEIINHKKISSGFKYAMSTGNWGLSKGGSTQTGVVQLHNTSSLSAIYSNLRKTNTHINKEGKTPKPRQCDRSGWGVWDPAETPEGKTCGLIKNLVSGAYIRSGFDASEIVDYIFSKGEGGIIDFISKSSGDRIMAIRLLEASSKIRREQIRILVNGVLVGYIHPDVIDLFVQHLRQCRRRLFFPFDLSIIYNSSLRQVMLMSDAGCVLRPVFVLENMFKLNTVFNRLYQCDDAQKILESKNEYNLKPLWQELLCEGVIEYLDKSEESENARVASRPSQLVVGTEKCCFLDDDPFTHMEIHPHILFSVCAMLIPFPDHNQSPRNTYQTAMGKQASSKSSYAERYKLDAISHTLWYPQQPLVQGDFEEEIGTDQLPMGQNIILGIMTKMGYDQEDASIFNQASIDRGLFRTDVKRSYKTEEKNRGADFTLFEKPDEKVHGLREGVNYNKLNDKGFAPVDSYLETDDAIFGKTSSTTHGTIKRKIPGDPLQQKDQPIKRDCSTILKTEACIVEKVIQTTNKDGCKVLKAVTRSSRAPAIGDKFSSRHGQKGTIGMIYPPEDMPFNDQGLSPDILINPHAKPTRMTIGMMFEALLGKAVSMEGCLGNGTPFQDSDVMSADQIEAMLVKHGFNGSGKERMRLGTTGEEIEVEIFTAPCFYQRLKHMAIDKIHARSRGPVQIITRQPVGGRDREGGFRFGEMERDCLKAHGADQFMHDRLFENSDPYETVVCKKCGLFAIPAHPHKPQSLPYCKNCNTHESVVPIHIPYASKLLTQELMAMNMALRIKMDESSHQSAAVASSQSSITGSNRTILQPHTFTQDKKKQCRNSLFIE